MNASIAIQVLPSVATNEELIPIVDAAIDYIRSFNLNMEVGPFETTVEGDYDTLMEIVKGCAKVCADAGASGTMVYVKINYSPEGVLTMEDKVTKHKLEA